MKKIQGSLLSFLIVVVVLSFTACGGNQVSEETAESTALPQAASVSGTSADEAATKADSSIKSAFIYSINDETYTEEGIVIKFPQLMNASDPKKGDSINKAIQYDIKEELSALRDGNEDMGAFSLDLKYELENYNNKVLCISYQGTSNFEKAAYPLNVYHTRNINMEDSSFVFLKDLFTIDNSFVNQFKTGKYLPANENLNLEKEGVSSKETIESQYSDEELIHLFQEETANYQLTKTGLILSVEVPHAIGDHLEMLVDYETLKESMINYK